LGDDGGRSKKKLDTSNIRNPDEGARSGEVYIAAQLSFHNHGRERDGRKEEE